MVDITYNMIPYMVDITYNMIQHMIQYDII